MNELKKILAAYGLAQELGEPCVLATVTHVDGSSYRRPGARMLITEDANLIGCVSGGCLERDLVRKAGWVLQKKTAQLVTYDTREDTEEDVRTVGAGLGCNGWIDILLEPIFADAPHPVLEKLKIWLASGSKGSILFYPHQKKPEAVFFENTDLPDGGKPSQSSEIYFESFDPPLSLILIGAGYDAVSLAGLAVQMGHDVQVVDLRSSLPVPRGAFQGISNYIQCEAKNLGEKIALNNRSAVIVMTHNAEDDLDVLPIILRAKPAYVGLLGPKVRGQILLDETAKKGISFSPSELKNVYFPVGLDIGAETPAEIALSILAEISAVTHARGGGLLRDRSGPIHLRGVL